MAQAAAGAAWTIHRSSEEKPEEGGGGGLAGAGRGSGVAAWRGTTMERKEEERTGKRDREGRREGWEKRAKGTRGRKNIQHDAA
jgi:hypothetical protein